MPMLAKTNRTKKGSIPIALAIPPHTPNNILLVDFLMLIVIKSFFYSAIKWRG